MEGSKLGLLVTRILLLIFGAIVLGVAASVSVDFNDAKSGCDYLGQYKKQCEDGLNELFKSPKPSIEYAAFTGAWGILAALVTLVAVFVETLPWIISLGFDSLAAIFYLAGGINNAVQRSKDDLFDKIYYDNVPGGNSLYTRWTTRWDTTTAFMFLGFLASVAAIVLVFMGRRSGGVRHSAV